MSAIADDLPFSQPWIKKGTLAWLLSGLMAMGFLLVRSADSPADSCPDGDEINAATASRSDVNTAIAAAGAGDCVVVPADASESWAGDITISGISLMGPGKGAASPTNITAGMVTINKHATATTRLIGFRFTNGNSQHIDINGSASNKPFVVHDNHFAVASGGSCSDGGENCWGNVSTNGGLFSENRIEHATGTSGDLFKINLGGPGGAGLASWQAATTFGDDDTTGENNIYFEDNVWINMLEITVDCDNGARVVMRNELFQDSSVTMHGGGSGTSGQDTSSYGCRQMEIYDSTFDRVDAFVAVNKWLWVRGSVAVFANNVVDEVDSSEFGGKREIILSVGCPGNPGYPLAYQVGQSTQTPDSTPDQPVLIFGNTGTHTGLINIDGENGGGITCASPGDYIQSGRDYQTSNTWGWTAYEYPHPLHP